MKQLDWLTLIFGVSVACILFTLAWPDQLQQSGLATTLGLFYTAWGIWHHWRTHTLTSKIFLEYAAYGLLVSIFLWSLVWL